MAITNRQRKLTKTQFRNITENIERSYLGRDLDKNEIPYDIHIV